MPISKTGKQFYTKEQYEYARYSGNALEYAQRQGYPLVRNGNYFKMADHDSMVFTPDGRWFWNSRGVSGGALEFQMYYEGKPIMEAVLTLAEEMDNQRSPWTEPDRAARLMPEPALQPDRASFRLPEKARTNKQLFGYLCNTRGLEKSVVKEMIRQGRLYQSVYVMASGKQLSNAVFLYRDDKGNAVGAYQRGMMDQKGQVPFKKNVIGSDKRFGWLLKSPFVRAAQVRVFEAAIDAASDASIVAMAKGDAWRNDPIDRLSLEGLNYNTLQNYLQRHPEIRNVVLMLDGDEPGCRAADDFARRLKDQGYDVKINAPGTDYGKDWNAALQKMRAMEQIANTPAQQPATAPEPVPEFCPEP